jgi:hemoglobin-like flavoprotein
MDNAANPNRFAKAKASFGRCINKGDLIGRFYTIFMASDPGVAAKFSDTDMDKQKKLLMQSINLAIMFSEGNPMGKHGIERIRRTHSKSQLNIHPEYYKLWLDSFLKAINECDLQIDEETNHQWREMLQLTIDYVTAGYDA